MELEGIEISYKVMVLGEHAVGKTNLTLRYSKNQFDSSKKATIGVDICDVVFEFAGKKKTIQLWDTAGQERFRSQSLQGLKGASSVILVFDLTRRSTFEAIETFLKAVRATCDSKIPILVVGNKMDLIEEREVSAEQIEIFASENNLKVFELSALEDSEGKVKKVFDEFFIDMITNEEENEKISESQIMEGMRRSTLKIKEFKKPPEKKCC